MTESGDSRPLPRRANDLLAHLWLQIPADERLVNHDHLRSVARQVSQIARAAGLRPEELIIGVKESWIAREELRRPTKRQRAYGVLADLISLCIDEFYLARYDPPSMHDAPDRQQQQSSDPDSPRITP